MKSKQLLNRYKSIRLQKRINQEITNTKEFTNESVIHTFNAEFERVQEPVTQSFATIKTKHLSETALAQQTKSTKEVWRTTPISMDTDYCLVLESACLRDISNHYRDRRIL